MKYKEKYLLIISERNNKKGVKEGLPVSLREIKARATDTLKRFGLKDAVT